MFWDKYYGEILRKVNIKKFAADVINKLRQEGHKVYIITARWDMPKENVEEIKDKMGCEILLRHSALQTLYVRNQRWR